MKNTVKFERAFNYFKKEYTYKMGGTQEVVLPNGKSKSFDDREYYSGRGSKYNKSINHDALGIVKVSRKEYSEFLRILKNRLELKTLRIEEQQKEVEKVKIADEKGVYNIDDNGYISLTDNERDSRIFNAEKLSKTLGISVDDALLLNSSGKTYVFAKQTAGKKTFQLYHASYCNDLSIHVEEVSDKDVTDFKESWGDHGQFAGMLGQTNFKNHFVC